MLMSTYDPDEDGKIAAAQTEDDIIIASGAHGFAIGSDAQGDIYYRGSDGMIKRLAPGTSGYYLKTQGAGADPVWAQVSGGGGGTKNIFVPCTFADDGLTFTDMVGGKLTDNATKN